MLLIFRRSNCIYAASDIVTLCDCPAHHNRCTGQSPTDGDDIRGCIDAIRPPEDEQRTA